MDELVKMITDKTGISDEAARQAITVVAEHLKSKLPEALAMHVDTLLAGGELPSGGMLGMLGGLFGSKS